MKFIIRCTQCGDQNQLHDDDRASIQAYFHRGTPNTKDRVVFYCENCGNKEEYGISWWPIDIDTPNKPLNSEREKKNNLPC